VRINLLAHSLVLYVDLVVYLYWKLLSYCWLVELINYFPYSLTIVTTDCEEERQNKPSPRLSLKVSSIFTIHQPNIVDVLITVINLSPLKLNKF